MTVTVSAIFQGEDRSMGYRTGKEYLISIEKVGLFFWVSVLGAKYFKPKSCPYGSWQKVLDNWELPEGVFQPM